MPPQHTADNTDTTGVSNSREAIPLDPRINPELRTSVLDTLCHHPRFTQAASDALADLVTQYARTTLAPSLQAFSSHASRQTVTEADVLLMVRNYPDARDRVQRALERYEEEQPPQRQVRSHKRKSLIRDTDEDDDDQVDVRRRKPTRGKATLSAKTVAAVELPSASSSSSSDTESDNDDPASARCPQKSSAQRAAKQFVDSSDEEDELMVALRYQHLPRPQFKSATSKPLTTRPTKPKFRLPRSTDDDDDDSVEDRRKPEPASDAEMQFPQTQSRAIQDIMANLEEDSVPSDCD